MAYFGSSEGSSVSNPMRNVGGAFVSPTQATTDSSGLSVVADVQRLQGANLWSYCSTNLTTDLRDSAVAGTITDGYQLGMRPGDVLCATQFTSHGSSMYISLHVVSVVDSSAGTALLSTEATGFISSTYS